MYVFNLKAEQAFDPKSIWSAYSPGSGRGCYDRLLGTGPDQPVSLPPQRHRDLFLLRGRRRVCRGPPAQ